MLRLEPRELEIRVLELDDDRIGLDHGPGANRDVRDARCGHRGQPLHVLRHERPLNGNLAHEVPPLDPARPEAGPLHRRRRRSLRPKQRRDRDQDDGARDESGRKLQRPGARLAGDVHAPPH